MPYPADSTSDSLRLHYVTERILASVLPQKDSVASLLNNKEPLTNGYTNGGSSSVDVAQDKYEKELILMLEQKHGKVSSSCQMIFTICSFQMTFDFHFRIIKCLI